MKLVYMGYHSVQTWLNNFECFSITCYQMTDLIKVLLMSSIRTPTRVHLNKDDLCFFKFQSSSSSHFLHLIFSISYSSFLHFFISSFLHLIFFISSSHFLLAFSLGRKTFLFFPFSQLNMTNIKMDLIKIDMMKTIWMIEWLSWIYCNTVFQ